MKIHSPNRLSAKSYPATTKSPVRNQTAPGEGKGPEDGFSRAERAELKAWKERLRVDAGVVLSPPAGEVDPEYKKVQDYLVDLMHRLAGEDLAKSGIEFHVELFSGDVPQAALDDDMSREARWKNMNESEWPLRSWLGTPSDSEAPIYRLGVNLGMLRELSTEDELAFVLANQVERVMDHAKLDPSNEETLAPANRSFVDSREMQAEADRAAIERMTSAGFNPRGALSALNTLYKNHPIEYPQNDLNRALVAAAHGQEAEGMRVGLVQAEVENYVRRQDPSTDLPMREIPTEMRASARAQYEKPVKNIVSYRQDHASLAEQLVGDETPGWMFGEGSKPAEYHRISRENGDLQDKEQALLAAVEHLDSMAELNGQQKTDGFLRLLTARRNDVFPDEGGLSSETQASLNAFFKKNSSDWDAAKFMATLDRGEKTLQTWFVRSIVFNQAFQEAADGALPGLEKESVLAWLDHLHEKPVPERLPGLIRENHENGQNEWPLAARIDNAILQFMDGMDPGPIAAETGDKGLSKATELSNELLGMSETTPEFQLRLAEATEPLTEASDGVREDRARLRLKLPYSEPEKVYEYLQELGKSEFHSPFSSGFQQDFSQMLRDLTAISTQQPNFVHFEGRQGRYPKTIEKAIAKQYLEAADSETQEQALMHLSRHIEHEQRVPAQSPRRQWLEPVVRELVSEPEKALDRIFRPDLSQHEGLLSSTLKSTYGLTEEELPNTKTKTLEALSERVKAGDFEPKRKDFQSDVEFGKAMAAYRKRIDEAADKLESVVPLQSRQVLGYLALIGQDKIASEDFTAKLDVDAFTRLLTGAENAVKRAEATKSLIDRDGEERVGADAGAVILDGFLSVSQDIDGLGSWYLMAKRSLDFSYGGLEARVGTKRKIGDELFARLGSYSGPELKEWLGKDDVLELLSPGQSSELLMKALGEDVKPGVDPEVLARRVSALEKRYKLIDEHPIAYIEMRDQVAERAKLQAHNVDTVFPNIEQSITDMNAVYRKNARALSGVIAMARERSPQEQINTIEYLMGRRDEMPKYIEEASESQSFAPFTEALQTTRADLLEADGHARVMVANSFLAGPNGLLRSDDGRRKLIDHFLKDIKPENRALAEKIASGVLYSHGEADTLAVAYILGQPPMEPSEGQTASQAKKLDEAAILNRLFDAYGVPGIKMKQYLAFTSEFADFKDAFEDAQDAALPLNYYQALKLVQNRFGDEWPKDLRIDRVLGSGSVNVAIRYYDDRTGKREVVSLGREDIKETTQYDFERFNKFIEDLTRTPEDRETFGYVLGLLNLIEASVALEFEKDQAMEVQQMAFRSYKHKVNGWNVRSIDAYRVENLGLFMEEAKGKTARKIFQQDEELYKDAMEALSKVEFALLRGQDHEGNLAPKPLFANPDIHDGQILIEKDTKTLTILDFGQAVPISNEDRVAGLDLLAVVGKADSGRAAAKRLNKRYFGGKKVLNKEHMKDILKREERMDCFIHLLSLLSRNGADVPLSSVHWVLGINRQLALTEKIGKPVEPQVKAMTAVHKVKLPLAAYNTAHAAKETTVKAAKAAARFTVRAAKAVAQTIGGWFGLDAFETASYGPDGLESVKPKSKPTAKPKRKSSRSGGAWKPRFSVQPSSKDIGGSEKPLPPTTELDFPGWNKLTERKSFSKN